MDQEEAAGSSKNEKVDFTVHIWVKKEGLYLYTQGSVCRSCLCGIIQAYLWPIAEHMYSTLGEADSNLVSGSIHSGLNLGTLSVYHYQYT